MGKLNSELDGFGPSHHKNRLSDKILAKKIAKGKKDLLDKGVSERYVNNLVSGVEDDREWRSRQKQFAGVINDKSAARLSKVMNLRKFTKQREIVFGENEDNIN